MNQAQEKIKEIKNQFKIEQKELLEARNDVIKIEDDIKRTSNNIADLKIKVSSILSQIGTVRYNI